VEKIVELNLSATKATLEEATAAAKQLAAAKDPQELLSLAAAKPSRALKRPPPTAAPGRYRPRPRLNSPRLPKPRSPKPAASCRP
jgi:hypothetical protein